MREEMIRHTATALTLLQDFPQAARTLAVHRAEEASIKGAIKTFFYVRKERARIESLYDEFKTAVLVEGIAASLSQTTPKDPCQMLAEIVYK